MPELRPFRALRYDESVAGDIADLVAPPYDVISPDQREALAAKNPSNIVHLILPEGAASGPSNRYEKAAGLLAKWRDSGLLKADELPALYLYEQRFTAAGRECTRRGVIGLLRLEAFGEGSVYAHEQTIPGPIVDRLELMRHTRTNPSQVMMLATDPESELAGRLSSIASRCTPVYHFEGPDGLPERLSVIDEADDIDAISNVIEKNSLIIADGHHRYTTALQYRDEAGTDAACMAPVTIFSMRDPGLVILPTHRVVDARADMTPGALVESLGDAFRVEEISHDGLVAMAEEADGPPTLGLTARGLDSPVRLTLTDAAAMEAEAPGHSESWRSTDVAVLHELILRPRLGFTPERILRKDGIDFVKDARQAAEAAKERDGRLAFIIRATTMDQMREIAGQGELMPQKSTYFYPKLTTGLVVRAMDL